MELGAVLVRVSQGGPITLVSVCHDTEVHGIPSDLPRIRSEVLMEMVGMSFNEK